MSNREDGAPSGRNIRHRFLIGTKGDRLAAIIQLMEGTRLDSRITGFGRSAVVVVESGFGQLIFKHAIALIRQANAILTTSANR